MTKKSLISKLYKQFIQLNKKKKPNNPIKTRAKDFPWGPVVINPPANAGDTGSIPGAGGFHMPRSTTAGPRTTTTGTRTLEPELGNRSHQNEKSRC